MQQEEYSTMHFVVRGGDAFGKGKERGGDETGREG